ncbi:hypothetical protein ANCDUO_25060 [Ancylostoma duodenale]|uniref:Uncharacterized protein n=1 Tax=Ancylostoma duodenale TaxID=51022 RepID=A0A0C2FJ97_9BILA|nr:hypothetical protein ANCDUO_25060 [Ancylostoma duodenale]
MQILYLFNKTHIDAIKKCHDLFNVPKDRAPFVSFPLCAASFGVFSTAAVIDVVLLSVSVLWLTYIPPKVYNATAPHTARYLMLCARTDSFGIIPEISPGEVSVLTVIALLATTRTIGQHLNGFERAANKSARHIIIAFFHGESFDYIGSSDAVI